MVFLPLKHIHRILAYQLIQFHLVQSVFGLVTTATPPPPKKIKIKINQASNKKKSKTKFTYKSNKQSSQQLLQTKDYRIKNTPCLQQYANYQQ